MRVDPQTRTIKVRAELPNPSGRYKPEMFATIRYVQHVSKLPVIPRGALLQQQDRNTVFRGAARRRIRRSAGDHRLAG